jgi:hypothetical protein
MKCQIKTLISANKFYFIKSCYQVRIINTKNEFAMVDIKHSEWVAASLGLASPVKNDASISTYLSVFYVTGLLTNLERRRIL